MISPFLLLSYSAQVAFIIAVTAVVLGATARRAPTVRLVSWRVAIGVSLMLPLTALLPAAPAPPTNPSIAGVVTAIVSIPASAATPVSTLLDWPVWLSVALAAGAMLRIVSLCIRWRLVRKACDGLPAARCALFDGISAALGVRARLVWCARVSHPFTYGSRRAVVVMPADLEASPVETRRAMFAHELIHVARRDWRWALAEEAAMTALWFHPAVRLAMRELRLAREEVVDCAAVALTGARRTYLETLLHLAGRRHAPAALPVSFFGARQLSRRFATLVSETSMSSRRLAFTSVVVFLAGAFTTTAAVRAFPLASDASSAAQVPSSEAGPIERQAYVAPRDAPPPARTQYVAPKPPVSGRAIDRFEVELRLVIDAAGRVVEARSLKVTPNPSAEGESRARVTAVLEAARQWRFEPPAMAPLSVTSSLIVEAADDGAAAFSSRERPMPIVLKNAVYPEDARREGVEGTVEVEITVDRAGRVSATRVISAPMPSMGDAAIAALKESTFRPGMKDGQAVPVAVTIAMRFALK